MAAQPPGLVGPPLTPTLTYQRDAVYDAGGRVTQDTTVSERTDGIFKAVSDYYYNATLSSGLWSGVVSGGYYMGGAVTRVVTKSYKNNVDGDAPDTLTVNSYVWGQSGAVLAHVDYDKDTGDSGNTVWTSAYTHDGSGYLTAADIHDERQRTVSLVNDAEGRVLQRDEADLLGGGDPRQLHYYMNGIRVGDISNNGTSNVDYAASIAAHTAVPAYGPFQLGAATGTAAADFDQSYDAINGLSYDGAALSYTVQGGDTLSGIAHQLWGDASLWYLIADANGLGGAEALAAGRVLTIPNKVHNSHNNADTWRPYDPNEAQGDLSPTDAKKPKSNKCATFGQILAAVVAVAVAAVLTTFGGPLGAIVAPYAANIASQGVLIATNNQDKFSWKSLAIVSLQQAVDLVNPLYNVPVIGAATSSAATQFLATRLGLQDKFSWAGVAAAGITDGVARGLGAVLPKGMSPTLQRIVTNGAALIASSAATALITGEDFGDTIMAALPTVIGSTIGQLAADGVASLSKDRASIKDALGNAKTKAALHEAKNRMAAGGSTVAEGPYAGLAALMERLPGGGTLSNASFLQEVPEPVPSDDPIGKSSVTMETPDDQIVVTATSEQVKAAKKHGFFWHFGKWLSGRNWDGTPNEAYENRSQVERGTSDSFIRAISRVDKAATDTKLSPRFYYLQNPPMSVFDYQLEKPRFGVAQVNVKGAVLGAAEVASLLPALRAGKYVEGVFELTEGIAVNGRRAIDVAQSYEKGIRGLYGEASLEARKFTTVVNGERFTGMIADDVTEINGVKTAIDAKYVDNWAMSPRNPASSVGKMPWAINEQRTMISQAQKYSAGFKGGAIYHTNSAEFAAYYAAAFRNAGIKNVRFIITPAIR